MQQQNMTGKLFHWGLFLAILVGLVFLSACEKKQQQVLSPGPTEVSVIKIATQPVTLTTQLPGRTTAFRIAEIRPQVNGLVMKRLFTEGSDVKAGDILYQIDPSPFQARLDNAQANLFKAQANLPALQVRYSRYKELLGSKAISQQEFDDAEAALKQSEAQVRYAKAAVDSARINLEFTSITAPISGRIGRSTVTDGALVGAYQAQALTTIQQLDPIYVDVTQSTSELLRLRRNIASGRLNQDNGGQNKARILLDDDTAYPLEGILKFQDVTVDPTTGSVVLRIVVPNPDDLLLPGMFVRAIIQEGINQNGVLVPQQAISRDPKGAPLAMVVDETSKVSLRPVVVDRAIGDQWLVQSGLKTGDTIVVEGLQRVRSGMTVKPIPFSSTVPDKAADNGGK